MSSLRTISCYENEIPEFVGPELDRLYGGRYASLDLFKVYGNIGGVSTYVSSLDGIATAIFLFKRQKQKVIVLNEGMLVGKEEAECFVDHLFSKDRSLTAVSFNFVETEGQGFSFKCQWAPCAEDAFLPLPDTVAQYLQGFGKKTRSSLNNRLNRIKRDFPSFKFEVLEKEEVDDKCIREIVRLSQLRMTTKNKVSSVSKHEEDRIIMCVKQCGFVCVATIDGRLCAGSISYHVGKNFWARILAHDALYDEYRLGFSCAFLAICECIKKQSGGKFYFGWGQSAYKSSLGGQTRLLSRLVFHRSWLHYFLNSSLALDTLRTSYFFRARQRILEAAQDKSNAASRLAATLVTGVRWLKAIRAN